MTNTPQSTDSTRDSLLKVFGEVAAEREYQIARWGTEADEKRNTPNDWVSYITNYATRWQPGYFAPYARKDLQRFRDHMVKVATLAFAAVHETDRILESANRRPDVLDRERDFENAGILPDETTNIPLAIAASVLRSKGFEVKFINSPVAMYHDQVVEAKAHDWSQDYSIFDEHEGKIIFLYSFVNAEGPLPDRCNDLGMATKIRFGTL